MLFVTCYIIYMTLPPSTLSAGRLLSHFGGCCCCCCCHSHTTAICVLLSLSMWLANHFKLTNNLLSLSAYMLPVCVCVCVMRSSQHTHRTGVSYKECKSTCCCCCCRCVWQAKSLYLSCEHLMGISWASHGLLMGFLWASNEQQVVPMTTAPRRASVTECVDRGASPRFEAVRDFERSRRRRFGEQRKQHNANNARKLPLIADSVAAFSQLNVRSHARDSERRETLDSKV